MRASAAQRRGRCQCSPGGVGSRPGGWFPSGAGSPRGPVSRPGPVRPGDRFPVRARFTSRGAVSRPEPVRTGARFQVQGVLHVQGERASEAKSASGAPPRPGADLAYGNGPRVRAKASRPGAGSAPGRGLRTRTQAAHPDAGCASEVGLRVQGPVRLTGVPPRARRTSEAESASRRQPPPGLKFPSRCQPPPGLKSPSRRRPSLRDETRSKGTVLRSPRWTPVPPAPGPGRGRPRRRSGAVPRAAGPG